MLNYRIKPLRCLTWNQGALDFEVRRYQKEDRNPILNHPSLKDGTGSMIGMNNEDITHPPDVKGDQVGRV